MKYKIVLANLSLEQTNQDVIRMALQIAKKQHAEVIGVAACHTAMPPELTFGSVARALAEEDKRRVLAKMDLIKSEFFEELRQGNVSGTWQVALKAPTEFFLKLSLTADIIVTSTDDGGTLLDPFRFVNAKELIMSAACPTMICRAGKSTDSARAVVAWQDSREARRAVLDALPLLRTMERVSVAHASEQTYAVNEMRSAIAATCSWLRRHGVPAEPHALLGVEAPFQQLLEHAKAIDAGLIVSGAYGRSRAREWAFGGMTEDLFHYADSACLFAH